MDLMEYMVRELYAQCGIPIKKGIVVADLDDLPVRVSVLKFPLVIKAQVQTGGRGKAGGIRFANQEDELLEASQSMLGMTIKGHIVKKLLIVEKAEISQEWYLSILLDRLTKGPIVIFSPMGGMEIEEAARMAPTKVLKAVIDPLMGIKEYLPRYLLSKSGLDLKYLEILFDLLQKLYNMFNAYDCTLVEINPLAVQNDGSLLALDGKVSVDDSALYRQPEITAFRDTIPEDELILEARKFNFLYIPCEAEGTIAVMSNGSGMIMSCIDLISKQGLKVGAALDLGGGATSDRIVEAMRIVLANPKIKALFINIFGGITRCDEVADGVKLAIERHSDGRLIIVRLEGTNKEKGLEIIGSAAGNILTVNGLREGVRELDARRNSFEHTGR